MRNQIDLLGQSRGAGGSASGIPWRRSFRKLKRRIQRSDARLCCVLARCSEKIGSIDIRMQSGVYRGLGRREFGAVYHGTDEITAKDRSQFRARPSSIGL